MALMEKKELAALIGNMKKTGHRFNDLAQEACIQAIGHVNQHGNVEVAVKVSNDILSALREGALKQGIVRYLESFGKLRYHAADKKTGKSATFKFFDGKNDTPIGVKSFTPEFEAALREIKWYSFTPETVRSMHTISEEVVNFLAKMIRRAAKADATGELPKDAEGVEYLVDAWADYQKTLAARKEEAAANEVAKQAEAAALAEANKELKAA